MKLYKSIAAFTHHNFHGTPIETTRIDMFVADSVDTSDPIIQRELLLIMEKKLEEHVKAMPHEYWRRKKEQNLKVWPEMMAKHEQSSQS